MAIVDADRCDSFCDELCPLPLPPPPLLLLELPVAFGLPPLSAGAAVGMALRLAVLVTGVLVVSAEPDANDESAGINKK